MKNFASLALSSVANPGITSQPLSPSPQPVASLAELRGYAFTYCFRGAVVMAAALGNYTLEHIGFAAPWLPWMVLMPLVAIIQTIRSRRQRKQGVAAISATHNVMRLLQKSFLLTLLLALGSASVIGWENAHPLILVLYGVGTVAAGRVLRFRPLLLGGAACVVLGAVAAAVPADTQLLLIAVTMLVSYVVPGYLLNVQSRAV